MGEEIGEGSEVMNSAVNREVVEECGMGKG